MTDITITRDIAAKVLEAVDAGLSSGLGNPIPGEMCVEAAVCYALGLLHGDNPSCVAPVLRQLKIELNDKAWSSPAARAKGLRRLALAQLGSADVLNEGEFLSRVTKMTMRVIVPRALRYAASIHPDQHHKISLQKAAVGCETGAYADAAAAAAAAADAELAYFAEQIVQILIAMDAPGCQWLSLTEAA